jgi:hypothetical protein
MAYLYSGDRYDIVNRGYQTVHTSISVDLGNSLLQQVGIRRVHRRTCVRRDELSSLRRNRRHRSTCKSIDNAADVERVRVLPITLGDVE